MKIAIGGDHAGFQYKKAIIELLHSLDIKEVKDFGSYSEESVDYPDYVHPLASAVEKGEFDFGILVCGSGNGVSITANKHQGIRAALCWNKDVASLARQHNNANVISIPARFIELPLAKTLVEIFLTTEFEGGRHQNRVSKIACA